MTASARIRGRQERSLSGSQRNTDEEQERSLSGSQRNTDEEQELSVLFCRGLVWSGLVWSIRFKAATFSSDSINIESHGLSQPLNCERSHPSSRGAQGAENDACENGLKNNFKSIIKRQQQKAHEHFAPKSTVLLPPSRAGQSLQG